MFGERAVVRDDGDVEAEFERATIGIRKIESGEPFVYAMFVFSNVRVDSVDWDFDKEGGAEEKVEFSCDKCEVTYFPQSMTGEKLTPAKKTAFYDREKCKSGQS